MADFSHVKVGDTVTRWFAERFHRLRVTAVDDKLITAGMGWQFERTTGVEYDPDLRWGTEFGRVGSFLIEENKDDVPSSKAGQT